MLPALPATARTGPVTSRPAAPLGHTAAGMLPDRFGAFEAHRELHIKLARVGRGRSWRWTCWVAEAVLEFGDDLRAAREAASEQGGSL